jgi:DNA helicase-2/ATP-dependent DNA helicase PcrA
MKAEMSNVDFVPYYGNFSVLDGIEQRGLVETSLRAMGIDYADTEIGGYMNYISRMKLNPENMEGMDFERSTAHKVYEQYLKFQKLYNSADFADFLHYALRIFDEREDIRNKYSDRFAHVMVDEFQDTNMTQYRLIKHLTATHKNIFAVGDPDQSIYGWRGADHTLVENLKEDFDLQTIKFEINYRSTQAILDPAYSLIVRNHRVDNARLIANGKKKGNYPRVISTMTTDEQAQFVANEISELVKSNQAKYSDFAILYRTNYQSFDFENQFRKYGIPHAVKGKPFFERTEIRTLLHYLRIYTNTMDDVAIYSTFNKPNRNIKKTTITKFYKYAIKNEINILDLMNEVISKKSDHGNLSLLGSEVSQYYQELKSIMELTGDPYDLIIGIIKILNYKEYLSKDSRFGQEMIENVGELLKIATDFETVEDLLGFAWTETGESYDDELVGVQLMTLHSAKGLEFPRVYIIGANDGNCPSWRAVTGGHEDQNQIEEERRLFYVGMTRAEEELTLCHYQIREYNGTVFTEPKSRFITEAGLK